MEIITSLYNYEEVGQYILYMLIRPSPISYDSSVGTYRDIDIKASFVHTLYIVQGWWPDGSCSGIKKKKKNVCYTHAEINTFCKAL